MAAEVAGAGVAAHRVVMAVIFSGALLAGVAILPGANERVAMLERDGHSREALSILEGEFARGERGYRTLYQMQLLYESEGNVPKARELLEAMAAASPRDFSIRNRLVQFYKNIQDQQAYVQALKSQIDVKYSDAACRDLIAVERYEGGYGTEQSYLQQCRQRGYRRSEDLSRLAELAAADGDVSQAANILRSIDDLKRLKSVREKYQLLSYLLDQDQPKEAERRAVKWIRGSKDESLAVGLIDTLAHSKFPATALEVAKDAGTPGDSVSLTVAERLIERSQIVPAQLYLNGWLERAQMGQESVAIRFVEAALAAADPVTALRGANKFGLDRLSAPLLNDIHSGLSNAGFKSDAETVQKVLAAFPAASGAPPTGASRIPDQGGGVSANEPGNEPPPAAAAIPKDPLAGWSKSLVSRMTDDALRRGQALGLIPVRSSITAEPISPGRGHGRTEVRSEQKYSSAKILKKTSRVLQRTTKIKSLKHRHRGQGQPAKSPAHASQSPAVQTGGKQPTANKP